MALDNGVLMIARRLVMGSAPVAGVGSRLAWFTSARRAMATGAAVGLIVAVCAFGVAFLWGTSPYWEHPKDDPRLHLIGYLRFLREAGIGRSACAGPRRRRMARASSSWTRSLSSRFRPS
jgi:hypothetical protein